MGRGKLKKIKVKAECYTLFFGGSDCRVKITVYGHQLDCVTSSKLLGVNVSSDLKWSTHIDDNCSKASK